MNDINTQETRAQANRLHNVRLAVYLKDDDRLLFDDVGLNDDEQERVDRACADAADLWAVNNEDAAILQVFKQFCILLPRTGLIREHADEGNADWEWAKVRCVIGGAGQPHFKELATQLLEAYPWCPFDPDESAETWWDNLRNAHALCGWPAVLAWIPWSRVVSATDYREKDAPIPQWARIVALFHLLKHMRIRPASQKTVILYGHAATGLAWPQGTNVPGGDPGSKLRILAALRAPAGRGKGFFNVFTKALTEWVGILVLTDYLPQYPTTTTSPLVLSGPWSSLVPANTPAGFFDHGLRMDGVWEADLRTRKITPTSGDDLAILSFNWCIEPSDDLRLERARFKTAIPEEWPVDVAPWQWLRHGFPNIPDDKLGDPDAYGCLFDAMMACGMMANDEDATQLEDEHPLFVVFPAEATPEGSTNTGKSKMSHAVVANAFRPGITMTNARAQIGSSAPSERAIVSLIRNEGTLSLDEWWPRESDGIMCVNSIASLTAGGTPPVGEVLKNDPKPVKLKYPICANMKTSRIKPDAMNRLLPIWLRTFTKEEVENSETLHLVESGQLAMLLRLSAIELVHTLDLLGIVGKKPKGSKYWRWHVHMEIAKRIAEDRGIEIGRLERTLMHLQDEVQRTGEEGEASGLAADCDSGLHTQVSVIQVFQGLSTRDIEAIIVNANHRAETSNDRHGFSAQHLLHGRAQLQGMEDQPLARLAEHWTGKRLTCSNVTMGSRLASDMRRRMPKPGDWWSISEGRLPSGWYLVRKSDNNGTPRFRAVYGPRDGYPAGVVTDSATFPPPPAKA